MKLIFVAHFFKDYPLENVLVKLIMLHVKMCKLLDHQNIAEAIAAVCQSKIPCTGGVEGGRE